MATTRSRLKKIPVQRKIEKFLTFATIFVQNAFKRETDVLSTKTDTLYKNEF